ncbi:unnamed protein product [Penicillium salamii]|uniref:GTP binding protein n=1 Tax=Penicillium salamii TaxID=1612424 RepID=A0A9W4NVQ7_9EURO|nr:unnamed protein product [Penicillium salamii]CAG8262184.1 unnamed protein product [Penicillium salamii]CAG8277195.1 unnamed protein product [Penicillium salamii]CAG8294663.1 unnamed protein product [Penicillium salamii]CAG8306652.1 unnamed protein product [Penicillium salamii]
MSAQAISTSHGAAQSGKSNWELPSIRKILEDLPSTVSSLEARTETIDSSKQQEMFRDLKTIIEQAQADEEEKVFDLKELHSSLEEAEASSKRGRRDAQTLQSVCDILHKLWSCDSQYLTQATEIIANGSRDPSWRVPFGQSGVLKFFLDVISSKEKVDPSLLLHSLRVIGNSCADTNENREIVVEGNHTLAIIRYFLDPDLVFVAIPVIYNICMDYEPAHAQIAANRTAYILLKLIQDGAIEDNEALLNFAYDLIELASEQAGGIENSPDGTILLLMQLAIVENLEFSHFSSLANSLAAYLEKERFQNVCVSNMMVEGVLDVLRRSFSVEVDQSSAEDVKAIAQLRLKTNQALAEVSASPLFAQNYPLDSPLSHTLKSWVASSEDQLQICACVMLGNLARSDEVCRVMVRELKIHEELISVLKGEARGAVLHSSLGFLKNLAIAGDNRAALGEAGIIPAVSRLWAYESVPQVQFSAASIARQVIISSVDNISYLLAPLSQDPDSPAHQRTYLSLLLSLFEKTDSTPIKTEIGRTVASICRTLSPIARGGDEKALDLLDRLFTLHDGVAMPIGAMITQTQWPVVRSEGWFALALMATDPKGCAAVVECLHKTEVTELLKTALGSEASDQVQAEEKEEKQEIDKSQETKDRENAFVLVQGLLKNESGALPEGYRDLLEDLAKPHASFLKASAEA